MTIRWGIVGCGDVCEVKSGPGFQKAEGSELVAVMRRSGKLAEDFAIRHSVPKWYDSADALINDDQVDAVYIASPPGSHLELALKVAAAGKPAYVEKPMARNASECHQMIEAFDKAKLPLFVAFYRRCVPKFVKAKQLINQGRLGEIREAAYTYRENPKSTNAGQQHLPEADPSIPWRLQARYSGGGIFMDMGCHALDLLDHLVGPLCNVDGQAQRRSEDYMVEDHVTLSWNTETQVKGHTECSFQFDGEPVDQFVITGTDAVLTMPCFADGPLELYEATMSEDQNPSPIEQFNIPNPSHIQQPLIQSIVDQLHGKGQCPSTGRTAARTNEVMDAVLTEYYGGRDDGFWDRPDSWPGRQTAQA